MSSVTRARGRVVCEMRGEGWALGLEGDLVLVIMHEKTGEVLSYREKRNEGVDSGEIARQLFAHYCSRADF